jgi:hypothetical protein
MMSGILNLRGLGGTAGPELRRKACALPYFTDFTRIFVCF